MAKVIVVGAGLAGMSVAARLAKQRHHVTLCERRAHVGGALRRVESGGFGWDRGAASFPMPAVIRDLFRKSGRPLEKYVDLQLCVPARRHVFPDGAVLDLPTGSRADQLRSVDDALGQGLGSMWSVFLDSQADVWNTLRLGMFVEPDSPGRLTDWQATRGRLTPHLTLARLLRRSLPDARLRSMVTSGFELRGMSPRDLPAFATAAPYLERSFGVWTAPGGVADLASALELRLSERSVDLRPEATVAAVTTSGDAVTGVELADGTHLDADLVVTAVDPGQVFNELVSHPMAARARRLFGAAASAHAMTHLGLRGDRPILPREVVLHGEPVLALHTGGTAPAGHRAWSVEHGAAHGGDVLDVLAERGFDVRDQVVVRVDGPPVVDAGRWDGFRRHRQRVAASAPLPGLRVLGAAPTPFPSVPFAAWEASGLAVAVGKA